MVQLSAACQTVTSYSIHYTKLYEVGVLLLVATNGLALAGPNTTAQSIMVFNNDENGQLELSAEQFVLLGTETWSYDRDEARVITSYSIHYTKLYDLVRAMETPDGCRPTRAAAWLGR